MSQRLVSSEQYSMKTYIDLKISVILAEFIICSHALPFGIWESCAANLPSFDDPASPTITGPGGSSGGPCAHRGFPPKLHHRAS